MDCARRSISLFSVVSAHLSPYLLHNVKERMCMLHVPSRGIAVCGGLWGGEGAVCPSPLPSGLLRGVHVVLGQLPNLQSGQHHRGSLLSLSMSAQVAALGLEDDVGALDVCVGREG